MGITDREPSAIHQAHAQAIPSPGPHVRTVHLPGVTVVELHGEIDLASAPEVQQHLDAATVRVGAQVIVDLRSTDFLDCTALALLCRAHRQARRRQGQLHVVCIRPWHLKILDIAGLRTRLHPLTSLEEATSTLE
ncbi:STAS domain-containing protein [Streptomyces sp. NPDC058268]|uniref:STAS domain-containing protein n=1 Tax=Streptomyces sp. NPDC058268 TaxID=3346413 RepID=UPI0036E6A0E5